jgi:hypothetical protein
MKTLQHRAAEAWGQYLNERPWSIFSTFTTEYRLSEKSARRLIENLHEVVESKIQDPLTTFWVAERFRDRNDFHLHALLHAEKEVGSLIYTVKNVFDKVSTTKGMQTKNVCLIEPFDITRGGAHYLCKSFLLKDPECDIILPRKYISSD